MPLTDLHAHTRHSDGTNSPSEVVYYYKRAGVRLMSVTDHDTLSANKEAAQKAAEAGILYVNGVEISTKEHDHLHFLGFNVDPENKLLQEFLEFNRSQRNERVKGIIKQLRDAGLAYESYKPDEELDSSKTVAMVKRDKDRKKEGLENLKKDSPRTHWEDKE